MTQLTLSGSASIFQQPVIRQQKKTVWIVILSFSIALQIYTVQWLFSSLAIVRNGPDFLHANIKTDNTKPLANL